MNILLNNRPEVFAAEELSVAEIMRIKKYSFKMLVIKLNNAFVLDHERENAIVREGDNLAIIHMESGG
jgi:thiamine biosynthesis protein ThiS